MLPPKNFHFLNNATLRIHSRWTKQSKFGIQFDPNCKQKLRNLMLIPRPYSSVCFVGLLSWIALFSRVSNLFSIWISIQTLHRSHSCYIVPLLIESMDPLYVNLLLQLRLLFSRKFQASSRNMELVSSKKSETSWRKKEVSDDYSYKNVVEIGLWNTIKKKIIDHWSLITRWRIYHGWTRKFLLNIWFIVYNCPMKRNFFYGNLRIS